MKNCLEKRVIRKTAQVWFWLPFYWNIISGKYSFLFFFPRFLRISPPKKSHINHFHFSFVIKLSHTNSTTTMLSELKIRWCISCRGWTPARKRNALRITLNCIWWRGFTSGDLLNVEYPYIAISPRYIQFRGINVP